MFTRPQDNKDALEDKENRKPNPVQLSGKNMNVQERYEDILRKYLNKKTNSISSAANVRTAVTTPKAMTKATALLRRPETSQPNSTRGNKTFLDQRKGLIRLLEDKNYKKEVFLFILELIVLTFYSIDHNRTMRFRAN